MSLFDWLRPKTELHIEPKLVQKLSELEARQFSLERELKSIDAEWSEWFDKFRHMYARLAKRIKDAAEVNGDGAQSREDAPQATISPPPSPGDHWIGGRPGQVHGRRNY